MSDRDSLEELFSIIYNFTISKDLPLTHSAIEYIQRNLGQGYDVYYRRRLSVCRSLIDLHIAVDTKFLDILLAVVLSNHMPGDSVPSDMDRFFSKMYSNEPMINEILAELKHTDYSDKHYYESLIYKPYPLIIRLTERSVLLEKLYEWSPEDALKYIRNTRDDFFPMCIYAKEHYPELIEAASILYEKMQNLTYINESLLTRFVETENAIRDEILSLKEENAVVRAMIADLSNSN